MPQAYVNGVNLYYEVSGAGSSVVLCHGYTGSHQDWLFQVAALAQKYQVVTIDHPGHGTSDAPSSIEAYSIPNCVNNVHDLLSDLGITKSCFVGHSLGGFVILQLALNHPRLVSSLVLVDTASGPVDIPGIAEVRAKVEEIAYRDSMAAAFDYNAQHHIMAQKRFERYPRLREMSRRRMLEMSAEGYAYAGRGMAQRPDLTPRLGEIAAPTLVVVGAEDSPYRQPAEILAKGISRARLQVIPQSTHCPHQEQPDVFNRLLLEFQAEVGVARA